MSSGCGIKPNSLLGRAKYIKYYQGNAIAVDGPNVQNKIIMENLRIPYMQISSSKVKLKAGQLNYFLNYTSMGDNATYLNLVASYHKDSVEEDNYLQYYYASEPNKWYSFGHVLTLSGNSTNRVEQIYLVNPNEDYPVDVDVMIATIDDETSFFSQSPNVAGMTDGSTLLTDIECSFIKVWEIGVTIAILNSTGQPQLFINIEDINNFTREGKIIIIDDASFGSIYLDFTTESKALQGLSVLNWIVNNPTLDITDSCCACNDIEAPIITFTEDVTDDPQLTLQSPPVTFTSQDGTIFYANPLTYTGTEFNKTYLINYLVDNVEDNMDGTITLIDDNMIILDSNGFVLTKINATGSYDIKFSLADVAGNYVDEDLVININVV